MATGPLLEHERIVFRLGDRAHRLSGVRLLQEVGLTQDLDLTWQAGTWTLPVTPPDVDRLEYLFEIAVRGRRETIVDPANPLTAGGAFGPKSVVQLPSYVEPGWLREPALPPTLTEFQLADIDGILWSPETLPADAPAPLLVVHDGPEFAQLAALTQYLGACVADGTMPALRAALLAPGDRNARYSADPEYAKALCQAVAALRETGTLVVGVGASLGALAMLHAHVSHPDTFDGLLLQSGSFFTPELDPQERDFSGFAAVTRFVAGLPSADPRPIPIAMTCGTVEENLANNRRLAAVLTGLGFAVQFTEVRDAHNYTAWRDALDPNLTDLVRALVSAHAA